MYACVCMWVCVRALLASFRIYQLATQVVLRVCVCVCVYAYVCVRALATSLTLINQPAKCCYVRAITISQWPFWQTGHQSVWIILT